MKSDLFKFWAALLCFGFATVFPDGLLLGASAATRQPNFVFILGEGHGLSSTSVQMDDTLPGSKSNFVRTPNLERLAREGMRLANFYAPSPRCTPSRVSYFTGKSPAQLHITFVNEGKKESGVLANGRVSPPNSTVELPVTELNTASLLKQSGYLTAHFGKWHMGRISPIQYGYDETDGANNNGGPENVENPHPKQLYLMTQKGIDFMERAVKSGKPFYLQLSHYASRRGGDALLATVAKVKSWGGLSENEQSTAAADLDLDIALGMVLDKLDQLGIADNTYVLFTTDHGTPGRNTPLAGGKGTVSEGGLRVPFIIRGPGIAAGVCNHTRAIGEDLLPTFAALAQSSVPLPRSIEGGSLAPVLTHSGNDLIHRVREEFVVHFPHYDKDAIGPASAIYLGDFKLIRVYETNGLKLFNIATDPGEKAEFATQMPDKVRELNSRLGDYLKAVNAQMPVTNPNYDPNRPIEPQRDGKKKKNKV